MAKKIENLLTLFEVSDFLRVKPSLVKYWVRKDRIPFIRLGRQIRFEEGEIRDWLKDLSSGEYSSRILESLK